MKTRILALLIILTVSPAVTARAPVELTCFPKDISVFQGEKIMITVEIKNNQPTSIRTGNGYYLSYHFYDRNGTLVRFENQRFKLPARIKKYSVTRYQCPVFFDYPKGGRYTVEFDIVKEGEFWGSTKKWKTARISLHLKELVSAEFKNRYLKTFYRTGNRWIDREQYLLRMTLKNCETVNHGKVIGFYPGTGYLQIWIRDLATLISYAKLHYPLKILETGVEKFLEHQYPNGDIPDWVNLGSEKDKNSVTADQESSLVNAAYEIAIEKPLWLRKMVRGKTVTDRLELALEWVWQNRRNPQYQLIWSGYTADWGDVENSYPDQRAIKLSDRSRKTFSVYTQSKFIQAMDRLIKIFIYLKQEKKARNWQVRREVIARNTRKYLYSEEQGYFLIHICPDSRQFHSLEKQILAVGGNSEAILADLMDQDQINRFLKVLEDRRLEFHLPNVSFTLLPPFPKGFFPHPLLSHPWQYQNGGQWDWIGGRLVRALFHSNFREPATRYLIEIIQKNLKNFNIFEWQDRQGHPGIGSAMFYAGAAGEIGDAIIRGYLGYHRDFFSHRIDTPEKKYSLRINQIDRFSIHRDQTITIHIEHLKKNTLWVNDPSQKIPILIHHRGVYRFGPERQSP